MYYTLRLSAQECAELLTLLAIAKHDAAYYAHEIPDAEQEPTCAQHIETIRRWQHRLSQLTPDKEVRE